jgi:GDPmannose 4,6-dehydratase
MSADDPKVAMLTGSTGQDGYYLTKLLLSRGYRVVACRRVGRGADAPRCADSRVTVVDWDLHSQQQMIDMLGSWQPREVFNLAAYSSGAGMFDDAVAIGDVNGLAVARLLEAVRLASPRTRLCQASSSEMFGLPQESPQCEESNFNPRSPYGAAKLYAHLMIGIYRQRYGLFVTSAILFNHESPRRPVDFVTRKITRAAAAIKLGLASELRLGNLDARRDWGFAADYAEAMWRMLQLPEPHDFVLATGETHSVREFCATAFERVALDYREYVTADIAYQRPAEERQLVGNPAKATRLLQWQSSVSFSQLVHSMVDADLQDLASGEKIRCTNK